VTSTARMGANEEYLRRTRSKPTGPQLRTPDVTTKETTAPALRVRPAAAMAGLLAGTAGVAAAEAVAGLLTGVTSPLLAVSNRAVDLTPRPVKEWAVATFGDADKAVLLAGVVATLALVLVTLGLVGVRRTRAGVVALLLLNLVGAAAALTDRAAGAPAGLRLVAPAAGLAVSVAAFLMLLRPLRARRAARGPAGAAESDGLPGQVRGDDLPAAFDRRRFLSTVVAVGAVAAGGGLATQALAGTAARSRKAVTLPRPDSAAPPVPAGASFGDVDGITPHLSSNHDFYRVDTALVVPDVPVDTWRLRIHGMVDRPLDLTFEDLLSRRLVERRITLTCVSNPVGGDLMDNTTWIGVPLADLLAEAGVRDGADAVRSTSADDMTIGTPLSALTDGRDAMVAVAMGGEPLPLEHGFPARMVVPGLYGYVSATKWLTELELTTWENFDGYWVPLGWAKEGPILTQSRIDTPTGSLTAGRVPIAGVAWAPDRGISKVEIGIDDLWYEAQLSTPISDATWVQWVHGWDATAGQHRLTVRATDGGGALQDENRTRPAPDGARGWHSIDVTVS
jgi:DMSO/TMAO reductase YedYZ molybdopterin-dependent catalytic subunit